MKLTGGPARSRPEPVRYAVVGLGYIAQAAVLPAFANAARNSVLAAIVSDDPVKLRTLARRYGVDRTYRYADYDACLRGVDAVYIALPNSMHREYAVRAARAGVHVLCEKPMAVTEEECREMIQAAEDHHVRLMVAYRLHFEAANLTAAEIASSGRLGDLRLFQSMFTMQVREGDTRLRLDLGGGPLHDLGIYCINAARSLFRSEPEEVFAGNARNEDPRFAEVPEMTAAVLRFPGNRLAGFACSFGAADVSSYRLLGTRGDLCAEPAYEHAEGLELAITINGRTRTKSFPVRDQFAPELLYFSDCIRADRDPEPSGREGLADVRIIQALQRSAASGGPVRLDPFEKAERPTPAQEIRRPARRKPPLVRARKPHH